VGSANQENGVPEKAELIASIVQLEWRMFHGVQNVGGMAECQLDQQTFEIMRHSQAMSWSEAALASYEEDLQQAERCGRNLMAEKYGRMMEFTSPWEYQRIKHLLTPIDPQAPPLIDAITDIILEWEVELLEKFPSILSRGRPIYSSEDTIYGTSLETYLCGELATYSVQTLQLYLSHIQEEKSRGINGSAITLEQTVQQYGFKSLEDANEILGR
jgi:hypothetical protein